MPEVLAIENAGFATPWSEEDFLRVLRASNCIGMVAELGERVVGFMIYELHKNRLNVLDFAVHAEFRRRSIGRQLVDKLVGKLSNHRRTRLTIHIRETNLDGHLFFRRQGFLATGVVPEHFDDGTAAYAFEYVLPD